MENPETYYRDHWLTIEPDRFETYDQMFRWRPEMDPLLTPADLASGQAVLRSGGRLHVIDSDWGMLAVEPIGEKPIAELFAAASLAYKTPLIGRKLYGAMRAAAFRDVRVHVVANADTRGHFAPIVFNMATYA